MQSWAAILANPETRGIEMRGARAYRCGEAAFVTCSERIGDRLLAATNLFVREDGGWKLVHHQAGPCNLPPGELPEEEESRLQKTICGRPRISGGGRSEEHTSELQSLMRISYAVFGLTK